MLYLSSRLDSLVRPRPQNILDLNFSPQKGTKDLDMVKVSYSQRGILVSSILPKNELENFNFCPNLPWQKCFVHFLEELKKTKSSGLYQKNKASLSHKIPPN